MELTTCARPYAKAAFKLARELGQLDEWSQMLTLCASISCRDAVDKMLSDPSLNTGEKAKSFVGLCEGSLSDDVKKYIRILSDKKRLSLLPQIDALFEQMKAKHQGYQDVVVASAFPLTEKQQEDISRKVSERLGRAVRMHLRIDKNLIGGVVVKAGDLVIDGSVRTRLGKLADAMIS